MLGLKEDKNELAETILELGSILCGKKLTMEDAHNHFMNIDTSKVSLCHGGVEIPSYISHGRKIND